MDEGCFTVPQARSHGQGLPHVACGSLGGTITMVAGAEPGITPQLTARDLIDSVPGLAGVATIEAMTLAQLPGGSLSLDALADAVAWARGRVEDGATGVVLIQGTDTIEETAYLAELLWDQDAPLVFTGAMRSPSQTSPDGAANLLAAVSVAAAAAARGRGVMVVLDDTIHQASLVHKAHSSSLAAFRSYGGWTLGRLSEGRVELRDYTRRGAPWTWPDVDPLPWVPVWTTYWGDDGRALRALLAESPDALVVAGFGAGHVSAAAADVIGEACARIPVVLSSRIGEGGAEFRTYGYKGSEIDLQSRGAVVSGRLDALKSRLLLTLLVASGVGQERIRQEFAERGDLH